MKDIIVSILLVLFLYDLVLHENYNESFTHQFLVEIGVSQKIELIKDKVNIGE